jgi:hypothetical protein
MNIQFVEAFWKRDSGGEYSARFTAKPFWSGFGDAWCWENSAVPLSVTLTTLDETDSLADQFRLFRNNEGAAIMILCAHGGDPENGQRHLMVRNNQGKVVPISWDDLRGMLKASGDAPMHNKVLLIDSCNFCANGQEAKKTMHETEIGMICGFRKSVYAIDSIVLEMAFVNYLLWEWHDGKRGFDPAFLQKQMTLFGEAFLKRYGGLSKELGFRTWRWTGKKAEEIIIST